MSIFGSSARASSLFHPILISLPNLISKLDELFGTFKINSGLPKRFILKVPNSSSNLDIKLGNEIKIGWNSDDARALDPK